MPDRQPPRGGRSFALTPQFSMAFQPLDSNKRPDEASNPPRLTDLVDVEVLRHMQEAFSAMEGISMGFCEGYEGDLITEPTLASRFLIQLCTTPRGRELCKSCFQIAGQSTTATLVPFGHGIPGISKEPTGLLLYASPVRHQGAQIATVVIGIRPDGPLAEGGVRQFAALADLDPDVLAWAATQLQLWSEAKRQATQRFADEMAALIARLYGQASQIQRQLSQLKMVYELSQILAASERFNEILQKSVQFAATALRVKASSLRLLNAQSGELELKAVHNLSAEYLNKPPILLQENLIDLEAFAGKAVYVEDVSKDPRILHVEKSAAEGIVSGLCVPLAHQGRTFGVLRVYSGQRRHFSEHEVGLLRSIAAQAAAAVHNYELQQEREDNERTLRQMHRAGMVQRRMIPERAPAHASLDIGCVYASSLEIGGDFYDFIPLSDGSLCIAMADVVGKGIPAALLVASIRAALRSHTYQTEDVAQLVAFTNRHMCRDTHPQEFATLFVCRVDAKGESLTFCNAGHEPLILLRAGRFRRLGGGGMVIGVNPDARYQAAVEPLHTGDILVLTTDGTFEAINFDGEIFGRERFRESILKYRDVDAQHLALQLLWEVRRFAGLARQSDDIAIVVIKVR